MTRFWVFGSIPVLATWILTNWFLALLCGAALFFRPKYLTERVIGNNFTLPVGPAHNDLLDLDPIDENVTESIQCVHVDPCMCFVAWAEAQSHQLAVTEELRNGLVKKNAQLRGIEARLARVINECDDERAYHRNQPTWQNPTIGAFVAATPTDRILSDLDRARRRVEDLEQEKDNWILEKNNMISKYNAELVKYKEQVDYARGARENMLVAVTEVNSLKAKIRTLQRDNKLLLEAGMQTRQALAAEREIHSEKCQDEAGCQMKISALEYKCKQLLDSHAYNDKMVVDAAIKLGMPKEDAQHMDLMAYLRAVTVEVARLRTLGVQGLGATNTVDFTVKQLQEELNRSTALKNRLEREVDRLGGDVIGIRNGWDTTKPKDWSVDMNTTYEENAYRMFPIYERLCQALGILSDTLVNANEPLPAWVPEVPRNDQTMRPGFVPTPQYILEANKFTNRTISSSEDLTQKLVVNEVQRLYNRALQLAVCIKNLSPKEQVPNGEWVVKDPAIRKILHLSDGIFKDVLVNILDDRRPVIASPTEQAPDPRMQKKFEIYTAMQEAIQALTNSIVANGHVTPQWMVHPEQQSKPWSSPDNLALNLMNAEMRKLEARINQLLAFMTEVKLPGTLYGAPLMDNHPDPDYVARWYELVAGTTYARLVLSHWRLHLDQKTMQIQDEKTGQLKIITVPVNNIMPLTSKDRYFRDALNRGESKEERAEREIKEGKWPHSDVIQSTTWYVPGIGHQIHFKVVDPGREYDSSSKDNRGNGDRGGYTQDENNSNPNDSKRGNDHEKSKKVWETKLKRVMQLKNHINSWGIKGNNTLPNVAASLRKNMNAKDIERANSTMDGQIDDMSSIITKAGYQVPKTVHKGGKMWPNI